MRSSVFTARYMLVCFQISITAASFTADSPVQIVNVSPPADGFTLVTRPTISFNFNLGADTVNLDSLEVLVDGTLAVWNSDDAGNYTAALSADLADGPHWAVVLFVDGNGNFAAALVFLVKSDPDHRLAIRDGFGGRA